MPGGRIIERGRPPLENPKEAVKLGFDHDILAAYRKTGSSWQTRINADLRRPHESWSMIRKSSYRFSEKIMLKQKDEIMIRFDPIGS
jgi:hypothetical protein